MVLSSVMLCMDNSEWMRNGDYVPDRLAAQRDAVNLVIRRRLQMNPENTVGVLHMAGRGVELKVTPSRDNQKLLTSTQGMTASGKVKLTHSIKIAMLALKHRQNKRGVKRIVVFIGSPIVETEKDLKKLGKLMKRDSVALDIILMGCDKSNDAFKGNENLAKTLVDATIKDNNSYLTVVAPGVLPSQLLSSSHLCVDGAGPPGSAPAPGVSGGAFEEYGGFDPSVDPEMAMVMRLSLEEARQNASSKTSTSDGDSESASKKSKDSSDASPSDAADTGMDMEDMDDDQLMREALLLSRNEVTGGAAAKAGEDDDKDEDEEEEEEDDDDEDEALRAALLMSQGNVTATAAPSSTTSTTATHPSLPVPTSGATPFAFNDPAFVQNMLLNLPGVNPDDPRIKAAMAQITKDKADSAKDGDKKKDGEK